MPVDFFDSNLHKAREFFNAQGMAFARTSTDANPMDLFIKVKFYDIAECRFVDFSVSREWCDDWWNDAIDVVKIHNFFPRFDLFRSFHQGARKGSPILVTT